MTVCDSCGHAFTPTMTHEEAMAEYENNFGAATQDELDDMAVVCDACYKEFMEWWKRKRMHH